jgi:hypothetical protein
MSDVQFPIGQRVRMDGHFAEPVTLEAVRPLGSGYECRVRLPDGSPDETILSKEEAEKLLAAGSVAAPTKQPADPEKIRLPVESTRIRLAYTHDRHFAVSLSGIRTLPHQIEAVYLRMLPQPRLRFLLADDPGAGKTPFRHTGRKGPGDHSRVRIKIIANSEAIAVRFQNICIA